MRIVIIQGAFLPIPPILGGAVEKIWHRMGQEFAANNHEVIHVSKSYDNLPSKEIIKGVVNVRVKGYKIPSSIIMLKLLDLFYSIRAIRKIPKEVDIIITNTFWAPILLRGKTGKKVYVDVQRVPKWQMKFYRHVGKLRGCSPMICQLIAKELPNSFHNLISYIPNPIPFDLKNLNIERENILLFVGRLHSEKGVHILIEAFRQLGSELKKQWKLVIVGPYKIEDGGSGLNYYNHLTSLISDANVEFTGAIYNSDDLAKEFQRAKIFCYPAQNESGDAAPVAPREAMAYGCVPVVSMLDCFNDFIENGYNGVTYDQSSQNQVNNLTKAIYSLLNNEIVLNEMSKAAILTSQKYMPQLIANQFIQDFESIVF